jgi:hypothetical protein
MSTQTQKYNISWQPPTHAPFRHLLEGYCRGVKIFTISRLATGFEVVEVLTNQQIFNGSLYECRMAAENY